MLVVRPMTRTPRVFYVVFLFQWLTTYGLMNIVIGVIVENTLNAAKANDDLQQRRVAAKTQQHLQVMRDIFEAADEDGGGTVDRDEFRNLMAKEETKQQFALLELPFGDAEVPFSPLFPI